MPATKPEKPPALPVNAFIGRETRPGRSDLAAALGDAQEVWNELVKALAREHGLTQEWNSWSPKYGWALRMKKKDRNIVYLGPGEDCFVASFILGQKAIAAAGKSALPRPVQRIVRAGKKYPEGTAVRIVVCESQDLEAVKELVRIKLEN